jgi:hypothetical protein
MPRGNHALYFAAVKADTAFAEALITEYGGRLANSMRYAQRTMAESNALRAAYDAKVAADDAWLGRLEFQTRPAALTKEA